MKTARVPILLFLLIVTLSPGCMGDSRPRIVIEWGIAPEELEGAMVEIDGRIAGKLTKFGAATRTAFAVEKGDHTIRIVHPRHGTEAVRVSTLLRAQRVMLLADYRDVAGTDGSLKTVLTLRM